MTIAELTRIDRSIDIKARPERVWRALTTADEISSWFQVAIDGPIAAGQEVWMTSQHEQCRGARFRVLFVEMTPPHRFVWQWHPGAVDPKIDYSKEPRTTVTFTLEPIETGTRLTVSETGFEEVTLERRAAVYKDNTQGWNEVITWIQEHVESAR